MRSKKKATTTTTGTTTRTDPARRRAHVRRALAGVAVDEFRPDVEGLRALAVGAVVAFHARLGWASGGFVGVDVFFVVSGFLITRLLLRELEDTGTVSLAGFWARRARRLLPASVLVVVVTLLASRELLPPLSLRSLGIDALAASGFVVNVVFARRLGDYFGSQLGRTNPSPLLHYWSLAVEEQFYLVWPLLLVGLTRRPRHLRRLVALVMIAIAAASFIASAWLTVHHPTWAFYLLPARMGELLAGALLALAGPAYLAVSAAGRAVAGWIGMAAITVAVVSYDERTPFPGTATWLPVVGTVLVVIAGGATRASWAPASVLGLRPLQWIGRHSYAIYLWHWPALVLAEARWGPLGLIGRTLAVAVAVVLSALSVRLVENPVRYSRALAAAPVRGLALGAGLCGLLAAAGALSIARAPQLDSGEAAAAPTLSLSLPAVTAAGSGASAGTAPDDAAADAAVEAEAVSLSGDDLDGLVAAMQPVLVQALANTKVPKNLTPPLAKVFDDRPDVYADGCVAEGVDANLTPCQKGKVGSPIKVALYGDSHAAQWAPAFERLAKQRGFELIVLAKGGCPTADVKIPTATLARTCPAWRDKVVDYLAAQRPAVVVVATWSGYDNPDDEWAAGFDRTLARIAAATRRVVVLGDNPSDRSDPAQCLSAHVKSVQACSMDRAKAQSTRIAVERAAARNHGGLFIDTTDWFCSPEACPTILGNVLVYRDISHLTTVAASWYAPFVAAAINPILDGKA